MMYILVIGLPTTIFALRLLAATIFLSNIALYIDSTLSELQESALWAGVLYIATGFINYGDPGWSWREAAVGPVYLQMIAIAVWAVSFIIFVSHRYKYIEYYLKEIKRIRKAG